ncbi:MAG: hypothetical protein IJW76_09665 [Clostridia bacterium]|nr:hypothetical protein [Clostridia bacterium]
MNILYDLYISCTEEECGKKYWAEHLIGTFKTKDKATTTMKKVMSEGKPFSKPDCEPRIQEVELVGEILNVDSVYRFFGYNKDGDIICSSYYAEKATAIQDFIRAKKNNYGRDWSLNTYKLG